MTTATLAALIGSQVLSPATALAAQSGEKTSDAADQGTHPAVTSGLNLTATDDTVDAKKAQLQAALDAFQAKVDETVEAPDRGRGQAGRDGSCLHRRQGCLRPGRGRAQCRAEGA